MTTQEGPQAKKGCAAPKPGRQSQTNRLQALKMPGPRLLCGVPGCSGVSNMSSVQNRFSKNFPLLVEICSVLATSAFQPVHPHICQHSYSPPPHFLAFSFFLNFSTFLAVFQLSLFHPSHIPHLTIPLACHSYLMMLISRSCHHRLGFHVPFMMSLSTVCFISLYPSFSITLSLSLYISLDFSLSFSLFRLSLHLPTSHSYIHTYIHTHIHIHFSLFISLSWFFFLLSRSLSLTAISLHLSMFSLSLTLTVFSLSIYICIYISLSLSRCYLPPSLNDLFHMVISLHLLMLSIR